MGTRRDYLASLTPPLAKANSRGRLSAAAHAAIDEAVKNGMTFTDMPVTAVGKEINSKDVSKVTQTDDFSATPEPLHSGGWFAEIGGKKVKISGNSVCTTCGFSLDYQNCLVSEVVGPHSDIVRAMR